MEIVPKPMVIIQLMGVAPDGRPPPRPTFLISCDVDLDGGRGVVYMTQMQSEALRFEDAGQALKYYQRQSTVQPLRDDGKPNRPLTAYNIQIMHEDAKPL